MVELGVRPIKDRFLNANHLFALRFYEGLIFGRVVQRRIQHYKPYTVIDANGNSIKIAAASYATQGGLRFRDPKNNANDVLFLTNTTSAGYPWFLYGAIGWQQESVNVYYRFPSGATIPGQFPNLDPVAPSSGFSTGYVSGSESPYDDPTDFIDVLIPPTFQFAAEYYNQDADREQTPVANILFETVWFEILQPDGVFKNMIGRIARREGSSEKAAPILTVGFADDPEKIGSVLTKDWNAHPISLDAAEQLGLGFVAQQPLPRRFPEQIVRRT